MQGRSEWIWTGSEPQGTIKEKKIWENLEWDSWSDPGHRNDWIFRQRLYLDSELHLELPIPKLQAGQNVWKLLIQPPSICLIKSLRSLRNKISQDPWCPVVLLPLSHKEKIFLLPPKKVKLEFFYGRNQGFSYSLEWKSWCFKTSPSLCLTPKKRETLQSSECC